MTEADVIARTPQEAAAFILSRCGGDCEKALWWADAHRAGNFLLNPAAAQYWGRVWDVLHDKAA